MDQKGQASVDLIFATLLLLIISSSILSVVSSGTDAANSAEFAKAKVLADNLSRSIDSVYSNGDGQNLTFKLPGDFNYTVKVNDPSINSNATVAVSYNGKTSVSNLIPASVTQVTMNPNETYLINNTDGDIIIKKLS